MDRTNVHANARPSLPGSQIFGWKVGPNRDDTLEHCEYCGSITPADAIKVLQTPGAHFSGSDWKYGWPHKFYIDMPNPEPDKIYEVGSRSGPDIDGKHPDDRWFCRAHYNDKCACPRDPHTGFWKRVTWGKRPHLHLKFYTAHLIDATPEEFEQFAKLSAGIFGVTWEKDAEGNVLWSAPCGIQKWGVISQDGKPDHSSMNSKNPALN